MSEYDGNTVSHLHGVEADRAEAVYAPGEWADWAAPLLIPDVHLLATRCKHSLLLVMVQSCEDCLQGTRIIFFFTRIKMWLHWPFRGQRSWSPKVQDFFHYLDVTTQLSITKDATLQAAQIVWNGINFLSPKWVQLPQPPSPLGIQKMPRIMFTLSFATPLYLLT